MLLYLLHFCLLIGSENDSVDDSVLAQDQIVVSRPPSPTLEQALMAYTPDISTNTIQSQSTEKYNFISI
jgi:hypothetical protein